IDGQQETSVIDFGLSPVVLRKLNGVDVLDCSDPAFRTMISKTVTIQNAGSQERTIHFDQPTGTDLASKSPLCHGREEFLRGSIQVHGNAQCQGVTVAGRKFLLGDCTIPADPESSVSFPLMYLPFNYVADPGGQTGVLDTANFEIDGDDQPF